MCLNAVHRTVYAGHTQRLDKALPVEWDSSLASPAKHSTCLAVTSHRNACDPELCQNGPRAGVQMMQGCCTLKSPKQGA